MIERFVKIKIVTYLIPFIIQVVGQQHVVLQGTGGQSNVGASSSQPQILQTADGQTLTNELEGNAWTYDKVEKTLKNENGLYLSDRKKNGQTVIFHVSV